MYYDYMKDLDKEIKKQRARENKKGQVTARSWRSDADGSASYESTSYRMSDIYDAYTEYRNYENY